MHNMLVNEKAMLCTTFAKIKSCKVLLATAVSDVEVQVIW